jgi:4-amino-4-deoxy-L-arabinose transferase-like glycosyltransferase
MFPAVTGIACMLGLANKPVSGNPVGKNRFSEIPWSYPIEHLTTLPPNSLSSSRSDRRSSLTLGLICLVLFFANLGGAALFEPDEVRNAEKAREILLLNDWVTPHENFVPVLDKPMFFYWLVAISFKFFGVSEWSGRLPSALAALGCLWLVFRFADKRWGGWVALWSTLILATNVEFFLLARLVIIEMSLTLFITLALCAFYSAVHTENGGTRRLQCLMMYLALSAGTLDKGLIGLIIPGMVCFVYLLITRKWSALSKLYPLSGTLGCLLLVAPWYLWAEARNPGYLRYYFWDEHFVRYLTDEFNRSKDWYYFSGVLALGFAPWTLLVPFAAHRIYRNLDDGNLFLGLWVVLPTVFFSASNSQLPHYILPIFPALAVLTGRAIAALFQENTTDGKRWPLYFPWAVATAAILCIASRALWPVLYSRELQQKIPDIGFFMAICGLALLLFYLVCIAANAKGYWTDQPGMFYCLLGSTAIFCFLFGEFNETASLRRSTKPLAKNVAPHVSSETQVVIYHTYLAGLIFYLKLERPVWVAAERGKSVSLGSAYVARFQPAPAPGYGKVFFTYEEFRNAWDGEGRQLRLLLKVSRMSRLNDTVGITTKELARIDDYILVAKP